MAGDWILTMASRLLRPQTVAAMIEPAVADLQYETRDSSLRRLARGYAGVWRAIGGAVARSATVAMTLRLGLGHMLSPEYQRWRDVAILFVVAGVSLLASRLVRHRSLYARGPA